jgi:hypothetical protein
VRTFQLSDLVKIDGLEKPEGVLMMELGGKAENVVHLGRSLSGFAGRVEDNMDVQVGEITALVAVMKKALMHELLPEKAVELVAILKERFLDENKPYKAIEGVTWEDIEKKLEASPDKLWSLNEMERTGGEPDVFGFDDRTGEFIFVDFAECSPRRNCVYDLEAARHKDELRQMGKPCHDDEPSPCGTAVGMAALMGVKLLTKNEYLELIKKGEFDSYGHPPTFTWIQTPVEERQKGHALFGDYEYAVRGCDAHFHNEARGFRASLRV